MGTDINVIIEVQHDDGKWYESKSYEVEGYNFKDEYSTYADFPFSYRSYGLFGFLANVRNISCVPSITDSRGLPEDSIWLDSQTREGEDPTSYWSETNRQYITDGSYYGFTWVLLSELLAFNYEQIFEDRRVNKVLTNPENNIVIYSSGNTIEEGQGRMISIRDFLGEYYFQQLEALKTFGEPNKVRLIMYFD